MPSDCLKARAKWYIDSPAIPASTWMLMFSSKWASMYSRTRRSDRGGRPPRILGRSRATDATVADPNVDVGNGSSSDGCPAYAGLLEFRRLTPPYLTGECDDL